MNKILSDCDTFVSGFVDDLVVYSNSLEEHREHLNIVLEKFRRAGVTLNPRKCQFEMKEIKILGHIVGNGTVKPDPDKLSAIKEFPKPQDKRQMRSFLGLINFYRKFAPNLAAVVENLSNSLKKNCKDKIVWTENMELDFDRAKRLVIDHTPLYIPVQGGTFVVQTDACDTGLGGILWQRVEEEERPIACISRKLNVHEKNYAIIEKECLAIKWAIGKFHDYLLGYPFIVRADHAPVRWLNENKDTTSRRMRWALALQSYDFSVEYIRGKDNFLADILSRNAV